MAISNTTLQEIHKNEQKFIPNLHNTVKKLLEYANKSPLSDFKYLRHQYNENFTGVEISKHNQNWMPVRNVIRIIAKIASIAEISLIDRIEINSMNCGCDYFEGEIMISINDNKQIEGKYKWQWTAFNGHEKTFDKFTIFPEIPKLMV